MQLCHSQSGQLNMTLSIYQALSQLRHERSSEYIETQNI